MNGRGDEGGDGGRKEGGERRGGGATRRRVRERSITANRKRSLAIGTVRVALPKGNLHCCRSHGSK